MLNYSLLERWELSPANTLYPPLLAELPQPPQRLFGFGDVASLTRPCIAVVGSRANTRYGQQVCEWLIPQLVQLGFTIVSGLATGIDALAHQIALEHNGSTIGVVATGLDTTTFYPKQHIELAKAMAQAGGAVISEYPAGTKALRHHFAARNRIIAGLAVGTIVIEARQKSGALITAKHSLEYNREVWAVPGSILSSRSAGTHQLLQHGAILLQTIQDITDNLPYVLHTVMHNGKRDDVGIERLLAMFAPDDNKYRIIRAIESGYTRPEQLVLELQLPASAITISLTELEIAGIVRKNPDYSYDLLF